MACSGGGKQPLGFPGRSWSCCTCALVLRVVALHTPTGFMLPKPPAQRGKHQQCCSMWAPDSRQGRGRALDAAAGQVCGRSCPLLWDQVCPWFLGREELDKSPVLCSVLCSVLECFQHPNLVLLWTLLIKKNVDTHQEVSIILKLDYKFMFLKYSKYYIIFVWLLALEEHGVFS